MIKIAIREDDTLEDINVEISCKSIDRKVLSLVNKIKDSEKKKSIQAYDSKLVSIIKLDDVFRIYSESRVVYLETKKEKFTLKETLRYLENNLKSSFTRISYSEIVNVDKIKNLDISYSGTIQINLINGKTTYVSRRYMKNIKEKLEL